MRPLVLRGALPSVQQLRGAETSHWLEVQVALWYEDGREHHVVDVLVLRLHRVASILGRQPACHDLLALVLNR